MRILLFAGLAAGVVSPGGAQVALSLDTSFRASRITHPYLSDAFPLEDGTVVTSGACVLDGFIGNTCGWMRLLPNGDLDESFAMNSGNGPIISTGEHYYLATSGGVRRRFLDGSSDPLFNVNNANSPYPGTPSGNYGDVLVQEDGYVLISGDMLIGDFWDQPAGWYSLMRLRPNARLDSTFDHRQTGDGVIWTLEPLDNGQLLASGVFHEYEGVPVGRIIRIDQDGSLDTTYHSPVLKGYAKSFIHQPNGRVIMGGYFLLENDADTTHLIRMMPDGALDSTFNNHTDFKRLPYVSAGDFAHSVMDLEQLSDGTIIVAGSFTHINGELRRGVALVDSSGNLLNTAFTGTGCGLAHDLNSTIMYSGITAISPAPDGSIFLSGAFWGFDDGVINDPGQRMICKLHGLNVGIEAQTHESESLRVYPNPGSDRMTVVWPGHFIMSCVVRSLDGRLAKRSSSITDIVTLDAEDLSRGAYILTAYDSEGRSAFIKWTKQ